MQAGIEAATLQAKNEAKAHMTALKLKIKTARAEAIADKIRWNTTYNLPYSKFTVAEGSSDMSIAVETNRQAWIPSWYREMVMSARSQYSESGEASSTTTKITSTIPASIDMGWTTADTSNASVWTGPNVWKGVDQN